ncbi:MAG: RNA degradosome polyphosphate kinase [Clostridiales bacterium]|nr:RNA degradosome polyphosphate kinase [Clostridiales bacterium]
MESKVDFLNPAYYENRELSWIKFDHRVLEEARDKSVLLLERAKFLGITSSNLDEFFMVRVASLKDMVHVNYKKPDIAGMTAKQQLEAINIATRELVDLQYSTYNRSLIPLLRKEGIRILGAGETLTERQAKFVDDYFMENVYPVLTPMAVDASRPFPLIRNKTMNIVALLARTGNSLSEKLAKRAKEKDGKEAKDQKKEETIFVTVQVPSVLPRLIQIPTGADEKDCFILLENMIKRNLYMLFSNYKVLCAYSYRIMRNADLSIDEDEASDLLKEIESKLKMRQWGEVIRLEAEEDMDERLLEFLRTELKVAKEDIFNINGPIDLTFLSKLFRIEGYDHLRYTQPIPQQVPEIEPGSDIFACIRKGDIFLHHPYQTFDPVVDFIRQASKDPDVLAIKQTLYRVSSNSPIISSLAKAAENGKQVTVLVELKARFDEEHNIVWARKLERAGCHVIYGLVGLKTHSKIALVVRREEDGIRRYVHLGTGNYNDSTAKLYTDCGIFTCKESFGADATSVFNMLSGYSEPLAWNELVLAPYWLRDKFISLIKRETTSATAGRPAHIMAKMNSLCDQGIIAALYEASAAGVKIDLIVRGICCLKVGIPGISENITVRSIVGNFLEHSRIFYFYDDGDEEVYMGSADWMPRNLDRRVEIVFPVVEDELKKKAIHVLKLELEDTVKARILNADGNYERIDKRGKAVINSQEVFAQEAMAAVPKKEILNKERVFIPAEPL